MENNASSSEILRWAKGKNGFYLLLDTFPFLLGMVYKILVIISKFDTHHLHLIINIGKPLLAFRP